MKTMALTQFRDSVSECVREAEMQGERIAITRHGEIVAYLVPVSECQRDPAEHPMFGSLQDDPRTVEDILTDLRRPRHAV